MSSLLSEYTTVNESNVKTWFKVAAESEFPKDGGSCVKYKGKQIAVFNFERRNKWYACQNLCPHKLEMVLSRGMLGETDDIPKIACPMHKKTFSLETGENLNGDIEAIATYPVKIEDGIVYVGFEE